MPEPIVTLNEESLRADLRELIRKTVEEMLGGLLEEEAGDLVGAERHERTADREACRAGRCERKLATARLKYVAESEWGSRRYLDVTLLEG